jgi:hypothetical protein
MTTRIAILVLILLSVVSPLAAHHSIAGTYDSTKAMTIRGHVTEVAWRNPHTLLSIDVTGSDGKIATWKIEMGRPANLINSGFRKEDIFSTPITLQVWPARDGSTTAAGRLLTLPDGRQFDVHDTFADNFEKK